MTYTHKTVPWACKRWEKFTDQDKKDLAKHLRAWPYVDRHKRIEYIKYLDYFCGAPLPRLMEYVKGLGE